MSAVRRPSCQLARAVARGLVHALGALVLCVAALFSGAVAARAESLIISLSTTNVAITSTYTGAEIAVFGVIEKNAQSRQRKAPYDVVVTVRGPRATSIVREKERLGPVFVNRSQRRFIDLPVYLAVVSTRAVAEIATMATRRKYDIGLDAIVAPPGIPIEADPAGAHFSQALIRLNQASGLFVSNDTARFISPNVFRATFPLPATAPVGSYRVEATVFSNGEFVARESTTLRVRKTGFEQAIVSAAQDRPLVYGLVAAALSLLFGWMATVVFRRD